MDSSKKKVVLALLLFSCLLSFSWPQTASVTISSYPLSVADGAPFDVVVSYTADLYQYGLAARVFLEVVDAETGQIIKVLWNDSDRLCYEGPSGEITFTTSVSGVNAIYFNAYISPVEFNQWFISELESYPRDGTYPYKWEGNGVTHDISYLGSLILADNVDGNYCYCSGITYQVFMDAWATYNAFAGFNDIYSMTVEQMTDFRREWYGWYSTDCAIAAIKKYKVGYEIPYTAKEKIKPGDDVQLWRVGGSGHSVIFIDWERDTTGMITGIKYWSTQSSTNGINYNIEYFGKKPGDLIDEDCVYARKVKPVDADDWVNRYGDANTSANPTQVGGSPTPTSTPTPTPTPTPFPEPKVFVYDITMTPGSAGKNYWATAQVTVYNDSNQPVEGATVYGDWSGAITGSSSGVTGADGTVALKSERVKGGGTFIFTVTNIVKDGYQYDSALNNETSDSITFP